MARPTPSSSNSCRQKPHYFFKVFFPNQSSSHLRIPPAFRKHIEAECCGKAYLKSASGSVWTVSLVKNSDGFSFEQGWKEFAIDQALVAGDFLVFKYVGNSEFSVLVFDSTACEKKKSLLAKPSAEKEVMVKEEVVNVGEDNEAEEEEMDRGRAGGGCNLKRKRNSDCSNSKKSCRKVSTNIPCSRKRSTSKQHIDYYKLVQSGHLVRQYRSRGIKVLGKGDLQSQRRRITKKEIATTLQLAMSFKSVNPYTIAVMKDSYVYSKFFMSLPSVFVREHLPMENTVMTVWDPNDKPWKIKYVFDQGRNKNRGSLSGGWKKFSITHNLESHDVCVFELIKRNHLRVHIYRVVQEIVPYRVQ